MLSFSFVCVLIGWRFGFVYSAARGHLLRMEAFRIEIAAVNWLTISQLSLLRFFHGVPLSRRGSRQHVVFSRLLSVFFFVYSVLLALNLKCLYTCTWCYDC